MYVCVLARCVVYVYNSESYCWFRRRPKKTSKVRVTGLCEGNSPVTGEFPVEKAGNAKNVSIWWHHHVSQTYTVGFL